MNIRLQPTPRLPLAAAALPSPPTRRTNAAAKRRWSAGCGLFTVLLGAACGGSSPEPEAPEVTANETTSDAPSDEREAADSELDVPEGSVSQQDPCAGGGCTPCGENVCLSGFFCDEGTSACAWIPECERESRCACLERRLPGCSCEERDGGLYVTCSE